MEEFLVHKIGRTASEDKYGKLQKELETEFSGLRYLNMIPLVSSMASVTYNKTMVSYDTSKLLLLKHKLVKTQDYLLVLSKMGSELQKQYEDFVEQLKGPVEREIIVHGKQINSILDFEKRGQLFSVRCFKVNKTCNDDCIKSGIKAYLVGEGHSSCLLHGSKEISFRCAEHNVVFDVNLKINPSTITIDTFNWKEGEVEDKNFKKAGFRERLKDGLSSFPKYTSSLLFSGFKFGRGTTQKKEEAEVESNRTLEMVEGNRESNISESQPETQ